MKVGSGEGDGPGAVGEAESGRRASDGPPQASSPPQASTTAHTSRNPILAAGQVPAFDSRVWRPTILPMSTTVATGISYLFHLVATLVWLGWSGLIVLAPPFSPDSSQPSNRLARRLTPFALLAFAALGVSGMYQLVTDPHYENVLALTNTWSRLMFAKHILYGVEALILGVMRLVVEPELRYLTRAAARGQPAPALPAFRRRYRRLAWLNLALGFAILALTAFITALP